MLSGCEALFGLVVARQIAATIEDYTGRECPFKDGHSPCPLVPVGARPALTPSDPVFNTC